MLLDHVPAAPYALHSSVQLSGAIPRTTPLGATHSGTLSLVHLPIDPQSRASHAKYLDIDCGSNQSSSDRAPVPLQPDSYFTGTVVR